MTFRTHTCNDLTIKNVGETVRLSGWLHSVRDLGAVVFFVLRDFYGVTQAVAKTEELKEQIRSIPRESTIMIDGKVIERESPNPDLKTGYIEIEPTSIEILGKCEELLPFEISTSTQSREDTRLKYRFLDLRNPVNKEKIAFRSHVISSLRKRMSDRGFLEITTPILTSSSPEGARDFIVPSRLHPGKFYALPQAPQQYKQLLMASGFDKYFQIAPCFRDEDARADRSPGEFYQLDMEMAFATQEDVFTEMEAVIPEVFKEFSKWQVDSAPFKRIKFDDAMRDYCSDKPDLRNPLKVVDMTDMLQKAAPFTEGKTIKAIKVENFGGTRKQIDGFVETAKLNGASSLYWFKTDENGEIVGGAAKFIQPLKEEVKKALALTKNDFVAFVAEDKNVAVKVAGLMRNEIALALDLLEKDVFRFCWIVDFHMYEENEETGEIEFSHNPFSMPQGGMKALEEMNPLDIYAYQYDLVCNGVELSSGAVRNHDPQIMIKAFEIAGYGVETIEKKFNALFSAFKFGAPPHAGIAPGVDRMVMLLLGEPNIREVIAFPMNKNAQDLLMNAPSEVTELQLKEVGIRLADSDKK